MVPANTTWLCLGEVATNTHTVCRIRILTTSSRHSMHVPHTRFVWPRRWRVYTLATPNVHIFLATDSEQHGHFNQSALSIHCTLEVKRESVMIAHIFRFWYEITLDHPHNIWAVLWQHMCDKGIYRLSGSLLLIEHQFEKNVVAYTQLSIHLYCKPGSEGLSLGFSHWLGFNQEATVAPCIFSISDPCSQRQLRKKYRIHIFTTNTVYLIKEMQGKCFYNYLACIQICPECEHSFLPSSIWVWVLMICLSKRSPWGKGRNYQGSHFELVKLQQIANVHKCHPRKLNNSVRWWIHGTHCIPGSALPSMCFLSAVHPGY